MAYTTHDVVQKYENRLNKSDSQDYDNLWWYQIEESFYKGMIEVIRRLKKGKVQKRESDEQTRDSIDDLQNLLERQQLSLKKNKLFDESSKIPKDYLYYKRLSPFCKNQTCESKLFKSYFKEESNVDILINDSLEGPDFKFEQCFHTLAGNKFRIYHNDLFEIESVTLTYYKLPTKYPFDKTKVYTFDFKDDIMELFIDEGIKIMSGDLENMNAFNTTEKRTEINN